MSSQVQLVEPSFTLPISDPPPAPSAALTAMGQHSEKVRAHLMDTAGHLFAQQGIDVLSNRAIA